MIVLTTILPDSVLNGFWDRRLSEHYSEKRCIKAFEAFASRGIYCTVFASSLASRQRPDLLNAIARMETIEFGGHTLHEPIPKNWLDFWRRTENDPRGPKPFQHWQIQKTLTALSRHIKSPIRTWCNAPDPNQAYPLETLVQHGIAACTGVIDCAATGPMWSPAGILHLPINIHTAQQQGKGVVHNPIKEGPNRFGTQLFHRQDLEPWANALIRKIDWNESQDIVSHLFLPLFALIQMNTVPLWKVDVSAYLEQCRPIPLSRVYDLAVPRAQYPLRQN